GGRRLGVGAGGGAGGVGRGRRGQAVRRRLRGAQLAALEPDPPLPGGHRADPCRTRADLPGGLALGRAAGLGGRTRDSGGGHRPRLARPAGRRGEVVGPVRRGRRLHGPGAVLPRLPPAAVQPARPGNQPHLRDVLRRHHSSGRVGGPGGRGGLWLRGAAAGARGRRGRAAARHDAPARGVLGRGPEDPGSPGRAALLPAALQRAADHPGGLGAGRPGVAMKILLVLDRRVDRGSIQAAANYVRAGDELGHVIALYGRDDPAFPALRFSTDLPGFDYVVFVIESWRHWMSGLRMPRFLAEVPRERRAILDADGMYNPIISVDGYDRNYAREHDRAEWLTHYRLVADRIMQPTFAPREPDVI